MPTKERPLLQVLRLKFPGGFVKIPFIPPHPAFRNALSFIPLRK
jgi:hypothetical protein